MAFIQLGSFPLLSPRNEGHYSEAVSRVSTSWHDFSLCMKEHSGAVNVVFGIIL